MSPTYQCQQNGVWDLFFFLFRSWVIWEKRPGFYTLIFTFLLITHNLNKIHFPEHTFVDIVKKKTCAKFQQKNIRSLNLGIKFCITWLVLPSYKKNQSVKANFKLIMQYNTIYFTFLSMKESDNNNMKWLILNLNAIMTKK